MPEVDMEWLNEIPGHSGVTPELKRSVFTGPGDNTAGAWYWHSVGPGGLSAELGSADLGQDCFTSPRLFPKL